MKEKKNIDRLFQEKFRNFEVQPDEKVWAGIDARRKKKKSSVVPLWLKVGSAAAAIILILLLSDSGIFTATGGSEKLVEQESQPNKQKDQPESSVPGVPESVADKNDADPVIQNAQKTVENSSGEQSGNKDDSRPAPKIRQPAIIENKQTGAVAETNVLTAKKPGSTTEEVFATAKQESAFDRKSVADPSLSKTDESARGQVKAFASLESGRNDLPQNKSQADPTLEEIAASKETGLLKEDTEDKNFKRWAVSPMIAPVYYNNFGGSGIDPQFKDNKKTGDVNLSYGLQISYAVSDKLKLRSGVNKVDLGYNTEQVAFSTSFDALSISSINYSKNSEIIQVADASSRSFSVTGGEITTPKTNYNASLSQRLGYIEIPLEAEYTLIDKRFGVQLIGGLSSLFLSDNEIYVTDGNFRTLLGESNSLNSTSFSTNVGLGMDYHINGWMRFNLEPMFKYQLNAYSNSVSGFRPYYLGLYSGLSIQF